MATEFTVGNHVEHTEGLGLGGRLSPRLRPRVRRDELALVPQDIEVSASVDASFVAG